MSIKIEFNLEKAPAWITGLRRLTKTNLLTEFFVASVGLLLSKPSALSSLVLPLALVVFSLETVSFAQDHDMHKMHDQASMAMMTGNSGDPSLEAKLLADKRESEFNHHLAGFFVLVAGLFFLTDITVGERQSLARLVWPLCFLLSGLFLLVWSDTELWPFGSQSWFFGLRHNPEVLQHKVFAVLLLVLAVIEILRLRGVLKAAWSGWVFPALAVVGSAMLLFHDHQVGMSGPNHMEIMERVQTQHYSFALTGFGIALSKGLSEMEIPWRLFFYRLFPALLITLGALLLVYSE